MRTFTICFDNSSLGPPDQPIFSAFSWFVEPFSAWVITGENGSGKSTLARALAGELKVTPRAATTNALILPPPDSVALISFERQRDVVFEERYHDDGEFIEGGIDPGTSARDFILRRKKLASGGRAPAAAVNSEELLALARRLGVEAVLERGLKYLSTGEIRKVLLCRELLRQPELIVFDEPYEGLDAATRLVLAEEIERLVNASLEPTADPEKPRTQVLVITDRYEHIPTATTHVLQLEQCRVAFNGRRTEFEARGLPAQLAELRQDEAERLNLTLHDTVQAELLTDASNAELVSLRNVNVTYSERRVLDDLSLSIRRGEHTLVRGPNGCGKTTLLNLINGDNPQVYANDVTICGMKRGSGESIWDVKQKLGQVSYALHVDYAYQCHANLIESVLSGFYDSIGLYREPSYAELHAAERWLQVVGLEAKRAVPFRQLSYGEQRVALILRAVIKQPPLLILDEPCHGLDSRHRSEVLTIADYIGTHTASTILYVTHDPAEQLACTRQIFEYTLGTGWKLSPRLV